VLSTVNAAIRPLIVVVEMLTTRYDYVAVENANIDAVSIVVIH